MQLFILQAKQNRGSVKQINRLFQQISRNFAAEFSNNCITAKNKIKMKLNKFFTGMASLAAAMALTACSQDEAELQPSALTKGNVISLTSQVAVTRAASDPQTSALSTSNKVGVFVTSGSSTITNGNNNEHSVGAAGVLTTSNTMNYPTEDGAKVNIYAYAPYASGMALSSDNNFSVSTDQSAESGYLASDLVYASKTGQASTSDAVSLTFAHKLSQLQIIVQKDDAIDISGGVTVYLTGTNTAATFNPTTGAVAAATTANVQDIKVATITEVGTVYAIAVPQDIAANTELVKITTSDKTYKAKLTTATSLTGGKAYSFTVKLVASSSSVVEVPVSLTATSITQWGDPTDLGSVNMEELITYEVGDYILKDGSLVKKSSITDSQKSNVAAIIFSITSDDEGYDGYAMSVKRLANRKWPASSETITTGPTTLADALAAKNGLTLTEAIINKIKGSETTIDWTSDTNKDYIVNFTGTGTNPFNNTLESSATNLSGWFAPSFGQMIDILNNLGEADFKESDVAELKNSSAFFTGTTADVFTKINALVKTDLGLSEDVMPTNTIFSTSTENNTNFWYAKFTENNNYLELGRSAGKSTGGRSVLPIVAYKLP